MTWPLVWKDKEVRSIRDIADALYALADEADALAFMVAYRAVEEHADSNVGYVIGYLEPAGTRDRIWAWTHTAHPVFR